jgi:hypothetical protein
MPTRLTTAGLATAGVATTRAVTTGRVGTVDPTPGCGEVLDRPDLLVVAVVHQALRAQGRALAGALLDLRAGDAGAVSQLRDWFDGLLGVVAHHHAVEAALLDGPDDDADRAAIRTARQADRDRLDHALETVAAGLTGMVGLARLDAEPVRSALHREAVVAAEALVSAFDDHLGLSEQVILPAALAGSGAGSWVEHHEDALLRSDATAFPFLAPWLVPSCTAEQEDALFAGLPRLMRTTYRFVWKPRYERAFPLLATRVVRPLRPTVPLPSPDLPAAA